MSLRPVPARWFELLTTREDLVRAVEILAHTGNIQLEAQSRTTRQAVMPDLRDRFEEYNRLLNRYQRYWPPAELPAAGVPERPDTRLQHALEKLRAWQHAADPVLAQLETCQGEQADLQRLRQMLSAASTDVLDFGLLTGSGPNVLARIYILPLGSRIAHMPPALLVIPVTGEENQFLVVAGLPDDIQQLEKDLALVKGRHLPLPAWIKGDARHAGQMVAERLQQLATDIRHGNAQLSALAAHHSLPQVLGDIRQLEWFLTHVSDLPVTENFAWVTGWTSDLTGDQLQRALEKSQLRAALHFPGTPMDHNPPMVLHNPWWSRPFELFARMLGTPARDELDPSTILVLMVPLMFGYMFGDIGQGLVLLLAGLTLRARWPIMGLFISCGLASMFFGWVFGSVFGMEHLVTPLWINPMTSALPVLFIPMLGGIAILILGLTLNGVQAFWRGKLWPWLQVEAAVIGIYVSLLLIFYDARALLVAAFCVLWYLAGSLFCAGGHQYLKTLGAAVGHLLESMMQLLINTVSFVRIGAFALAHAGLSLAVTTLAEATTNLFAQLLIIVTGNIVVLVLEGLVVSIQTTRLVLFEFFIRFLQGTGRIFEPLTAPATSESSAQGAHHAKNNQ